MSACAMVPTDIGSDELRPLVVAAENFETNGDDKEAEWLRLDEALLQLSGSTVVAMAAQGEPGVCPDEAWRLIRLFDNLGCRHLLVDDGSRSWSIGFLILLRVPEDDDPTGVQWTTPWSRTLHDDSITVESDAIAKQTGSNGGCFSDQVLPVNGQHYFEVTFDYPGRSKGASMGGCYFFGLVAEDASSLPNVTSAKDLYEARGSWGQDDVGIKREDLQEAGTLKSSQKNDSSRAYDRHDTIGCLVDMGSSPRTLQFFRDGKLLDGVVTGFPAQVRIGVTPFNEGVTATLAFPPSPLGDLLGGGISRRTVVSPALTAVVSGRTAIGDLVQLTAGYRSEDDAAEGPLQPGDVGLETDGGGGKPFKIKASNDGRTWWYRAEAIEKAGTAESTSEQSLDVSEDKAGQEGISARLLAHDRLAQSGSSSASLSFGLVRHPRGEEPEELEDLYIRADSTSGQHFNLKLRSLTIGDTIQQFSTSTEVGDTSSDTVRAAAVARAQTFEFMDTGGDAIRIEGRPPSAQCFVDGHGHVGAFDAFDAGTGEYRAGGGTGTVPSSRRQALSSYLDDVVQEASSEDKMYEAVFAWMAADDGSVTREGMNRLIAATNEGAPDDALDEDDFEGLCGAIRANPKVGLEVSHIRAMYAMQSKDKGIEDDFKKLNLTLNDKSADVGGTTEAWTGSYNYGEDVKGDMKFTAAVADGKLSGSGIDDVGSFAIAGTVDAESIVFVKQYDGKHAVEYTGTSTDGVAYDGEWSINSGRSGTGGFHLDRPEPEQAEVPCQLWQVRCDEEARRVLACGAHRPPKTAATEAD